MVGHGQREQIPKSLPSMHPGIKMDPGSLKTMVYEKVFISSLFSVQIWQKVILAISAMLDFKGRQLQPGFRPSLIHEDLNMRVAVAHLQIRRFRNVIGQYFEKRGKEFSICLLDI